MATLIGSLLLECHQETGQNDSLKEGDLIFQSSKSEQGKAIEIASGSKYSHMGVLFKKKDRFYVYEAVGPVRWTALEKWIDRGRNDHYVVKRLKKADSVLSSSALERMKEVGKSFLGKEYDPFFEWSDERIYCSELVRKIYQRGLKIRLGTLKELSAFQLEHPLVKRKLKERYGTDIPLDEKLISPASILASDRLKLVRKAGKIEQK
ncbi:MAG: YiiX family permuted papain-like enzyme [Flavobacteriales bacterium]